MRQETELAAGMQRQYQLRLLLVQPLFAFLVKRFILGLTERNLWFSQAPVPWFILRTSPAVQCNGSIDPDYRLRTSVERYFLNGMAVGGIYLYPVLS